MKFGLLFNTDYHAEAHGPPANYYAQLLEQVGLAERLGYHSAWFGEHHYASYSFGAPSLLCMAAAERTERIRLGTGVSLLPVHHPIRLAEEYATLDVLSGGRFEYGIGRGFLRYALDLFGIDEDESHDRYHEAAALIVEAWTRKEPFSFDGRFWSLSDYEFFPKPLQQPHPPIYASAVLTPESYVWTAEMGFNLATACFVPNREGIRAGVELYRKTLEQRGLDPASRSVLGVMQMYCGESYEASHREAGEAVLRYLAFFAAIDQKRPHQSKAYEHHKGGTREMFDGMTSQALDEQRLVLMGDPETLIDRIEWLRDYYGLDYLLLEMGQGGLPHAQVMESLERFGREVMPHFRQPGRAAEEDKDA